jgi:hypothetical protein
VAGSGSELTLRDFLRVTAGCLLGDSRSLACTTSLPTPPIAADLVRRCPGVFVGEPGTALGEPASRDRFCGLLSDSDDRLSGDRGGEPVLRLDTDRLVVMRLDVRDQVPKQSVSYKYARRVMADYSPETATPAADNRTPGRPWPSPKPEPSFERHPPSQSASLGVGCQWGRGCHKQSAKI